MEDHRIALFIVNNIAPYGYEINSILGLPSGFRYRFRFDEIWIALDNPFELRGREGLVVLRELETAKFYPLRRVVVERVTRVGDIYHIEYRLARMINWASAEADRVRQIASFTARVEGELQWPNEPGEYMEKAVLMSADHTHFIEAEDHETHEPEREWDAWGKIAKQLGSMSFYKDFDFFRVVGLTEEKGKEAKLVRGSDKPQRYRLSTNTSYRLDVFQRAVFTDPFRSAVERKRDLVLTGVPDETFGIRTVQHVLGKYDRLGFAFKTAPETLRRDSFLLLRVEFHEPSLDAPPVPPLEIPIHIGVSLTRLLGYVTGLIVFFVSVAFLFFAEVLLPLIGVDATAANIILTQRIVTLTMVLTGAAVGKLASVILSTLRLSVPVPVRAP